MKPLRDQDREYYDGGGLDNYLVTLFHPDDVLGFRLGIRTTKRYSAPRSKMQQIQEQKKQEDELGLYSILVRGVLRFLEIATEITSAQSRDAEIQRIREWLKDHNREWFREILLDTSEVKTFSVFADPERKQRMILEGMRDSIKGIISWKEKENK